MPPSTLVGPDGQKIAVKGTQRYRVDKQKLVALAKEPLWLKGFKGATADESIGSLVAKVDGRDVAVVGRLSQGIGRYPRSDRSDP